MNHAVIRKHRTEMLRQTCRNLLTALLAMDRFNGDPTGRAARILKYPQHLNDLPRDVLHAFRADLHWALRVGFITSDIHFYVMTPNDPTLSMNYVLSNKVIY